MMLKACMKMLSSRSWWWLPVEVKAAEEEVFLEASCVKMQSPEERVLGDKIEQYLHT